MSNERDSQPISHVLWIDLDQIEANNYNPNSVAKTELKLLQTSILADGYTQPVVTFMMKNEICTQSLMAFTDLRVVRLTKKLTVELEISYLSL